MSLEDKRRETIKNLHDLEKQLDKVLDKTKNEKFQKYLTDLKEQAAYTTNNDKVITKKKLKKVFKLLNKINIHLRHSFWNHGKIKRKIKKINRILDVVI